MKALKLVVAILVALAVVMLPGLLEPACAGGGFRHGGFGRLGGAAPHYPSYLSYPFVRIPLYGDYYWGQPFLPMPLLEGYAWYGYYLNQGNGTCLRFLPNSASRLEIGQDSFTGDPYKLDIPADRWQTMPFP